MCMIKVLSSRVSARPHLPHSCFHFLTGLVHVTGVSHDCSQRRDLAFLEMLCSLATWSLNTHL